MSRNATTGAYTRVDNSFSNPVVGTTISPTDADTFFDDVEASMNSFLATSTSSVAIATGAKTLTLASPSTKVFPANMFVHAFSQANSANYMFGQITSYNSGTGALVIDVQVIGGSGTITDWVVFMAGARGAVGATGSTGERAGFKYTFNSATSGDPGTGKFLFNNATFGSATALNISETDGESIGLASLLATLDDSTSTNKCIATWVNSDGTKGFIGYLTGTLTDNGTYDTFSFTPVTSFGSPVNNDVFRFQPLRVGDKGADGAGTGDVSSAANFTVDNRLVRTDRPTSDNKSVQQSAVTVDDSGNMSGVAVLTTTGNIELGNASDTTLSRSAAGRLAVESKDALLKGQTDDLSTAGYTSTSVSAGTKTTGTYTFDPTAGSVQHVTNGGAHTFAPPSSHGAWQLDYVNNGSAGALTTSGWTKVDGDPFDTTNAHAFRCYLSVGNSGSHMTVKRMV